MPLLITVAYGQTLRKLGLSMQRRKKCGNIYRQKNTRHDISSDTPDYEEAQEEELPANRFCVRDEMNDCPSKENKTHKDNEDGSDYDNKCVCVCFRPPVTTGLL